MKVISSKNLPIKLPVWSTLLTFHFLMYYNASQWLFGAFGVVYLLLWIFAIIRKTKEKETEILKD